MPDPATGWREPASSLPLRWGTYRGRYLAGLALAFAGGLLVQVTSTYSLAVRPVGLFLHITGWCILPGVGWRRVLGAAVSALTTIVLLNGAPATGFLAIPLLAWLLLRRRPLASYLAVVIPPFAGFLLAQYFPDYGWSGVVLPIAGAALVGAAWLGRWIATMSAGSSAPTR
jgi:hypothetical protein